MKIRANVRTLVLSIAAPALLGATVVLVAQQASPAVQSVPVCVKANGQLRMQMGANMACDPSEQRVNWVVGGEVTDITPGEGLTASRQGGTVQLAVSPTLLQKDRIFSGFNDGPRSMPSGFPQEIARLDLPAGSFAMFAKMTVTNTLDEETVGSSRVLCDFRAEGDFDQAELTLPEDPHILIQHPYNTVAALTMQVVHHFSTPGSVTLSCYEQDADADLALQDLKIIAIGATSISNVFLGTP